jgi:hypothetical protein
MFCGLQELGCTTPAVSREPPGDFPFFFVKINFNDTRGRSLGFCEGFGHIGKCSIAKWRISCH